MQGFGIQQNLELTVRILCRELVRCLLCSRSARNRGCRGVVIKFRLCLGLGDMLSGWLPRFGLTCRWLLRRQYGWKRQEQHHPPEPHEFPHGFAALPAWYGAARPLSAAALVSAAGSPAASAAR